MKLRFFRTDVLFCLISCSALFVPRTAVAEDNSGPPNMVAFAHQPAINAGGLDSSGNTVSLVSCITPAPEACNACASSNAGSDLCGGCGGCGNSCGGRFSLAGLLTPSAPCFDNFISPITNPVFFEDPRTLTEARAIFMHHNVPLTAQDGDAQVFALQLRAALSDRLSLVAAKSGFITSTSPLIDDGWADMAVGLKYNLLANPQTQRLVSGGVSYELPIGSTRAQQGNGDGEFNLYLTGGSQLGQYGHWVSAAGLRLPSDTVDESQVCYWSNHWDCQLLGPLYGLIEVNWFHWMQSGENGVPGIEGLDLFNLGSTGVAGNDIVTGAAGFRYKASDHLIAGIAWEFPLSNRRDIIDNRWTIDLILRY